MESDRGAVSWSQQEADDALCQANYTAILEGTPELSVLVSKDKDLQMCHGFHLDWDTGDIETVTGYGYIKLDRSLSSPKIVGKGPAYFWAQMLTGDTADGIQGLPMVSGCTLNAIKPTKVVLDALKILSSPDATSVQKDRAQAKLDARKPGRCGPVIAYELLKDIKSDKQAFDLVKNLYKMYGESIGFVHWKTGEAVSWKKIFVSEAQLLWMRRTINDYDVLNYFKECQ